MNRPEVDGPDGVSDLLEADDVTFEETTDEDLSSIPSQSRVTGDLAELEVSRVLERIGVIGERPLGVSVNGGRGFHEQGLVRSQQVIDSAEPVERALLSAYRGGGR